MRISDWSADVCSSDLTSAAIADVDARIGMLVDGLKALRQPANLVIVADHGMAATSSDRVVALDKVADPKLYRAVENGPYASLDPTEGSDAALATALQIGRAHVCTPVTNAHLVCRLLLDNQHHHAHTTPHLSSSNNNEYNTI